MKRQRDIQNYTVKHFYDWWNYLSSGVDSDLQGLLTGVGELKGVPVSVSLELSSWLPSSEQRFEPPPLELRFRSPKLWWDGKIRNSCQLPTTHWHHSSQYFHFKKRSLYLLLASVHKFSRQVLVQLLLFHMCSFNSHSIFQHVNIAGLSVDCKESTTLRKTFTKMQSL